MNNGKLKPDASTRFQAMEKNDKSSKKEFMANKKGGGGAQAKKAFAKQYYESLQTAP